MKKLIEHTYGAHIYMKMELSEGNVQEIDVFFRTDGEHYRTTGDHNPEMRNQIIDAFNKLY